MQKIYLKYKKNRFVYTIACTSGWNYKLYIVLWLHFDSQGFIKDYEQVADIQAIRRGIHGTVVGRWMIGQQFE